MVEKSNCTSESRCRKLPMSPRICSHSVHRNSLRSIDQAHQILNSIDVRTHWIYYAAVTLGPRERECRGEAWINPDPQLQISVPGSMVAFLAATFPHQECTAEVSNVIPTDPKRQSLMIDVRERIQGDCPDLGSCMPVLPTASIL